MKLKIPISSVLLVTGFSFPVALGAAEEDAAADLAALFAQTDTLQADVMQLILDQDGRELQEAQARFVMAKPDRFYWEIIAPYAQVMVTDGETIWLYEPDLEQVTIQEFDEDLDRTPVMILNGSAETIAATYDVSAHDMELDGYRRFILYPKQPDSLFERMSLTFAGDTLEEMQFEDSLGQKTSLTLTGHQTNLDLPANTFTFDIPEGLEVIDTRGE